MANPDQTDSNGNGLGDACDLTTTSDLDGDGFFDADEAGAPLCLTPSNHDLLDDSASNDGCEAAGTPESNCVTSVDDDADGRVNDGCPQVGVVSEGAYNIGTNHLGRCGVGFSAGQSSAWPLDLVSGGVPQSTDKVTIGDLASFLAPVRRLDTRPPNANFNQRWDLKPGPQFGSNWIGVSDLGALVSGVSGFPPMNSGQKVYGSSFVCTAHPVYGD
jgi:hypothetical protein